MDIRVNCCLSRVEAGTNLRSDSIELQGLNRDELVIGQPFRGYGCPLDPEASFRIVQTSDIVEIVDDVDRAVLLRTASGSIYRVTYFDD